MTVTIGAWFNALAVLGLEFGVGITDERSQGSARNDIPVVVRLADYPQLAALAWQVRGSAELSARAAFDVYERNERHIDQDSLTPEEAGFMDGLRRVFGDSNNV